MKSRPNRQNRKRKKERKKLLKILNADLTKVIARNGMLAVILAYTLWVNKELTEKIFTVIENNTAALYEFKSALKDLKDE